MKKTKYWLGLVGFSLALGLNSGSNTAMVADATTKVTLKNTKTISPKQLTKKNNNGRVFDKIPTTGSKAKTKHWMKNYTNSTWIATKEAKLSNGNTYYYVTSTGGGNYGWIWSGYMKNSPKYYVKSNKAVNLTGYYAGKNDKGEIWDSPYNTKVKAKKLAAWKTNGVKTQFYKVSREMVLSIGSKYYYVTSVDGKYKG